MSEERFEHDWLSLREPVDHRSRSRGLAEALAAWVRRRTGDEDARTPPAAVRPLRVVDLGCGTGSNLRWLAPRLPGPQHWTLLDHDPALLARVTPPTDTEAHVEVETVCADLGDAATARIADADVVTCSALLDLVSRGWLDGVAAATARSGAAALFALSYDGSITWDPADPTDAVVRDAFNAHQRREKGLGGALGPDAGAATVDAFRAVGYAAQTEATPWRLGAPDAALVDTLLAGWLDAAAEQRPDRAREMEAWAARRRTGLAKLGADATAAAVTVGHLDVLALPST